MYASKVQRWTAQIIQVDGVTNRVTTEWDWKARVAEGLPPEIAEEIPLDLFGLITVCLLE